MLGSRAWATNYANSTGRSILVRITAASKANSSVNFLLDGRTYLGASANLAGEQISNEILVPPGSVYAATGSIGAIYSWDELR